MNLISLTTYDMKRLKPDTITKYSIPSYAAFNDGDSRNSFKLPHLRQTSSYKHKPSSWDSGIRYRWTWHSQTSRPQQQPKASNRNRFLHHIEKIAIARPWQVDSLCLLCLSVCGGGRFGSVGLVEGMHYCHFLAVCVVLYSVHDQTYHFSFYFVSCRHACHG